MTAGWRHPVRWVIDLWTEMHEQLVDRKLRFDLRPLIVLVTAAVSLSLQEFVGEREGWYALNLVPRTREYEIYYYAWWAGWRVLGYLILPALVVKLVFRERVLDYGWSPRGFLRHLKLYLVLYLGVLPLAYLMSLTKAFQRIYPFYKYANHSVGDFVAWELLYAAQFFSLEFFFRGFMLFALRRTLGIYAIFVMIVPYNMIHYGKTLAESLGAIVAGLVLGTISLRTKSIWGGIFVHVAVALTMDLLCVRYLPPHP